jgi:hypothetical protein
VACFGGLETLRRGKCCPVADHEIRTRRQPGRYLIRVPLDDDVTGARKRLAQRGHILAAGISDKQFDHERAHVK